MSSKEPPKKKSKRDNELFCVYSKCTCVVASTLCQYALARTMWKNTRLIMDLKECFCKSSCAMVKYAPPQDTLELTTWRK